MKKMWMGRKKNLKEKLFPFLVFSILSSSFRKGVWQKGQKKQEEEKKKKKREKTEKTEKKRKERKKFHHILTFFQHH